MSILNEDSGSLIIAQGRNEIQINSSNQNAPKEDDLFELSRDDPTLSFQIEEEKRQEIFIQICEPSQSSQVYSNIENQQQAQNKKKRKEIFQKFKRPQTSIVSKIDSINSEDNLLNIFDSIFKTKTSQPDQNSQKQPKFDNNFLRPQTQIIERSKTPSAEKRERLKIFGKKHYSKQFKGILPSELVESQVSVVPIIPEIKMMPTESRLVGSPILAKKSSDSINFSIIQNRLSGIFADQNLEYSREEQDIKNILESQIFKDDEDNNSAKQQVKASQNVSKVITSSEKIQIQMEQAIPYSLGASPDKKQLKLSELLPISTQRNPPPLIIQMEESKVLRSQTSIISNSPLLIQAYSTNEGFKPQNSMANIVSPNIADLTIRKDVNNQNIKPTLFGNRLFESLIIQSIPSIIKVNVFQSQKRMPSFLREIRKHISIYPNFYAQNNPNTMECICSQFNILFDLFTQAIKILSELCQTVLDLKSKKVLYLGQLANTLTVQFFLESGWQKFIKIEHFESIKPIEPFESREWSYQKAKTALKNYENIVEYYKTKGIKLDINQDKGKRKYFQVRQKFWDICGNMKLISEDIYSEMIDCHFPHHFYVFLQFLKGQFPKRLNEEAVSKVKRLTRLYKTLKNENDLLINSDIGVKIKQKLDLMANYLIVY